MARAHVVRTAQQGRTRRQARARAANIARLLQTENWSDLTEKANASPNHVRSLDRWRELVRRENSSLNDEQVDRLAERMRREFYAAIGRKSGEARRAAREASRTDEAA